MKSPGVLATVAALLFLSLGALFGGYNLVTDPTGASIGLDNNLLQDSIFHSYRIPGIILLVVFGFLPLLACVGLLRVGGASFRGYNWAWWMAFALACALITWLAVQLLVIGYFGGIQGVYLLFAVGLLVLVVVCRRSVRER